MKEDGETDSVIMQDRYEMGMGSARGKSQIEINDVDCSYGGIKIKNSIKNL